MALLRKPQPLNWGIKNKIDDDTWSSRVDITTDQQLA
jgi:hypothetical protein